MCHGKAILKLSSQTNYRLIVKFYEEMKAIDIKRHRFGYRKIDVLLERKGVVINHRNLLRPYIKESGRCTTKGPQTGAVIAYAITNGFTP
jgi:hypothetical protein